MATGKICLSFALFIAGLQVSSSRAEPVDSFALSPEQLFGATVMSVSRSPEKWMDSPAAIYVLSNEDILRSGATSIPEALRLVPGVQVARAHSGGWAISVRGFNSGLANKLLVLLDGREVYDQLFSGVYWDLQDTMLEDIERIEVIRGPGGTLWGANAVNGVINIITKSARDTQGTLATALGGNQEGIAAGRHGGRFGDAYYRAYARALYRDEENALSGEGAQDPQRSYRSGFRADWQADSGRDEFTLQGDMHKGGNHQLRISPANALVDVASVERIHSAAWNVLGRWTRSLPDDARLSVQGYVDYVYRDQMLLADQRTSVDLDAQYELSPVGRHKAVVGGRYRLSLDRLAESTFITASDTSRNDQLFSGFVQDKITLSPDAWYLTLGSKFEHNDYSGFEVQPSARLQWHIDNDRMAWASLSRAVRTPSQLEQDLTITFIAPVNFFGLLPNPNFDSEELIAYEAGYREQLTSSLLLDVAGFYNDYDKLSATVAAPAGPFIIDTTIANGTTAETYGGEAVLSWRLSDALNLSASYSLLLMQLHGPAAGIDSEVAEGQSPQHQFNARSQWNIRDDLYFDAMLYYVDALPAFNLRHHWRLDMGLGWKITDHMQFNLVGQNLIGGDHREFTALDEPFTPAVRLEPGLYGKVTWRF